MPLILPRRNPLAYPCGVAPGFDPTHPAARNCQLSAVALSGNAVNILSGAKGTLNGTPTWSVDGKLGNVTRYATSARSAFTIAGPATPIGATVAAIFSIDSIGAANRIFIGDNAASNFGVGATTGLLRAIINNTGNASTIAVVAGVPYFVAISFLNASTLNFVLTNLLTGQILTQSTTTANSLSVLSSANFNVANNAGAAAPLTGPLAAVMWSYNTFLSMTELMAWAADPWSFWYPRKQQYNIAAAAAGGFPWWAVNNNPGVIGTGTY